MHGGAPGSGRPIIHGRYSRRPFHGLGPAQWAALQQALVALEATLDSMSASEGDARGSRPYGADEIMVLLDAGTPEPLDAIADEGLRTLCEALTSASSPDEAESAAMQRVVWEEQTN
jgi:hypothetical protein